MPLTHHDRFEMNLGCLESLLHIRYYRLSFATLLGFWLITVWTGAVKAQDVQTVHYAPGWNGNLKAGMMAPDPGFYMQSTTMFFNARKFKDGSGDTASSDETDYVLTALALVWRPHFSSASTWPGPAAR
jgi:hypothetical protein